MSLGTGWQTAARSKAKRACSEFSTAVLCGTVLSAGTCGPATAAEGRGGAGPLLSPRRALPLSLLRAPPGPGPQLPGCSRPCPSQGASPWVVVTRQLHDS